MTTRAIERHRRMIERGGAQEAIRARVRLIAVERQLPKADVARVLKAPRSNYLVEFALAHGVSLNWLTYGDIRGLALMRRRPWMFRLSQRPL